MGTDIVDSIFTVIFLLNESAVPFLFFYLERMLARPIHYSIQSMEQTEPSQSIIKFTSIIMIDCLIV